MKPSKKDNKNEYFEDVMKVKECFAKGDLLNAKKHYENLWDICDKKLRAIEESDCDAKEIDLKKTFVFCEYHTMVDCLSYEELYTLTGHKRWIQTDCRD